MDALTEGGITKLAGMKNSDEDPVFQPTLQILNVRKVNASGNQDRFRVRIDLNVFALFCVVPCIKQ